MDQIDKLKRCVVSGLNFLSSQKRLKEAEVFAAHNHRYTLRLNYTSHIPCNALQELKSDSSYGVGVRVSQKKNNLLLSGSGSETNDLTLNGIKKSLKKAKESFIPDPNYVSLPKPVNEKPTLKNYHDPKILAPNNKTLVFFAEQVIRGVFDECKNQGYGNISDNLIIGGDITLLNEQIAIGNTHGIQDCDISTILMATITVVIERYNAKGTGWSTGTSFTNFDGYKAGQMAAKSAISTIGGTKIPTGKYNVILGPQPVCAFFSGLILGDLMLESYASGSSLFKDKLGKEVISSEINVYDDGSVPGMMASKRITCEGLPTGRTDLIRNGKLVGLLTDTYWSNSPENKTGTIVKSNVPRNGFRFGGGGRHFSGSPSIQATNLFVKSSNAISSKELLKKVISGIYIGRLWYLYPINLGQADFTGTVIADSYLIEDGKLTTPLKPNKVRLNDNWLRLFRDHVIGVSNKSIPTLVWAGEEIVVAPEIALSDMLLEEIEKDILTT